MSGPARAAVGAARQVASTARSAGTARGRRQSEPFLEQTFLGLQQAVGNQAFQDLLSAGLLHPKLRVGAPDGPAEREADRMAKTVTSMSEPPNGTTPPARPIPPGVAQRRCAECEEEEDQEQEETVRPRALAGAPPGDGWKAEQGMAALRGGRRPLGPALRSFFEPRFGEDLSGVRVHTGAAAAEAAHSIGALAFTLGRDVVFGAGEYAPASQSGRFLLAHELAHQDFSGVRIHTGDSASETARSLRATAFTAGNHIVFGSGQYEPGSAEGTRLLAHELTHVVQQGNGAADFATLRLQGIGPASSVEAHEAFTELQRKFLQANGVDPAGLSPTVAQRLAELISIAERAVQTGEPPHIGPQIGDTNAAITLSLAIEQASMIISRQLDLATGKLQLQFSYQDVDGNRIEATSTLDPTRVLNLVSLEEVQPTALTLPSLELGERFSLERSLLPDDSEASLRTEDLDDFSDLFTSENISPDSSDILPSEKNSPGSSEGIGSFFEGAVLGEFGENDSWSAIAGTTVVGFIPIVGQIADVRDLVAAFKGVAEGREGGWLNVGIATIAFVPGLDWLKSGKRIGKKIAKESTEAIAEGSEATLKGGSDAPKGLKSRLSAREHLARLFGDRLQSKNGALERLLDNVAQLKHRVAKGGKTIPVHGRAAAMELRTLFRYLKQGIPDGRKIAKLEVIPSAGGSPTPDFVVHFPDGTQQRIEVTTLTAAPKGNYPTGKELAYATMARSGISVGDVARAIGNKAGKGQLTAPLAGVPSGGAIIVNVMGNGFTAEMASAAVEKAVRSGKLGPHVEWLEISFMQRGLDQKSRQVSHAFSRSSSGEYVPMLPMSR